MTRSSRLGFMAFVVVLFASSSAFAQTKGKDKDKEKKPKTQTLVIGGGASTEKKETPKTEGRVKLDTEKADKGDSKSDKTEKADKPESKEKKDEKGKKPVEKTEKPKALRFDVVEIEGRLKSPQLVYFLRRVRAEFASGDLGHRSFLGELSETRKATEF